MTRFAALVVLSAGLLGSGLIGVRAADGVPDQPRVEVIESGVIIRADLRGTPTGAAGTILPQRDTVIRRTA